MAAEAGNLFALVLTTYPGVDTYLSYLASLCLQLPEGTRSLLKSFKRQRIWDRIERHPTTSWVLMPGVSIVVAFLVALNQLHII